MSRSATNAKKLKAVANPKQVIQDLCGLISLMHRNQEFDLSGVVLRSWESECDFNGGFAANELDAEHLVRRILALANKPGFVVDSEKFTKVGS